MMDVTRKADVLQNACISIIEYMKQANEIFQNRMEQDPDRSKRWKDFYLKRKQQKEVVLPELRDMLDKLQPDQVIEAEVLIR